MGQKQAQTIKGGLINRYGHLYHEVKEWYEKDKVHCIGRTTHKCSQTGVICSLFSYVSMLHVVYSLSLESPVS